MIALLYVTLTILAIATLTFSVGFVRGLRKRQSLVAFKGRMNDAVSTSMDFVVAFMAAMIPAIYHIGLRAGSGKWQPGSADWLPWLEDRRPR